eukprot:scaffold66079_cov60-Phaeocystis_antarctica.AAC.9
MHLIAACVVLAAIKRLCSDQATFAIKRLHSQALGAVPQIIDASQPAGRLRAVVQLRASMRQWLESGGRRIASPGVSMGEASRNPSGIVAPRTVGPLAIPAALTAQLHAAPKDARPTIVAGRERERLDRKLDGRGRHRGSVVGRAAYGEHLVGGARVGWDYFLQRRHDVGDARPQAWSRGRSGEAARLRERVADRAVRGEVEDGLGMRACSERAQHDCEADGGGVAPHVVKGRPHFQDLAHVHRLLWMRGIVGRVAARKHALSMPWPQLLSVVAGDQPHIHSQPRQLRTLEDCALLARLTSLVSKQVGAVDEQLRLVHPRVQAHHGGVAQDGVGACLQWHPSPVNRCTTPVRALLAQNGTRTYSLALPPPVSRGPQTLAIIKLMANWSSLYTSIICTTYQPYH